MIDAARIVRLAGLVAVALVVAALAVPLARAMMPPPESAELIPPAAAGLAPNAALVIRGYFGTHPLPVTVKAGGRAVAVTVSAGAIWGFGYGSQSVAYVRPASGDWPAGARLSIETAYAPGKHGTFAATVAKARDEKAPAVLKLGPARVEKRPVPMIGDRAFLVVPYPAPADDGGGALRLNLLLASPGGDDESPALDTTIVAGVAGELLLAPGMTCRRATLTDAAGNVTKLADRCF